MKKLPYEILCNGVFTESAFQRLYAVYSEHSMHSSSNHSGPYPECQSLRESASESQPQRGSLRKSKDKERGFHNVSDRFIIVNYQTTNFLVAGLLTSSFALFFLP